MAVRALQGATILAISCSHYILGLTQYAKVLVALTDYASLGMTILYPCNKYCVEMYRYLIDCSTLLLMFRIFELESCG